MISNTLYVHTYIHIVQVYTVQYSLYSTRTYVNYRTDTMKIRIAISFALTLAMDSTSLDSPAIAYHVQYHQCSCLLNCYCTEPELKHISTYCFEDTLRVSQPLVCALMRSVGSFGERQPTHFCSAFAAPRQRPELSSFLAELQRRAEFRLTAAVSLMRKELDHRTDRKLHYIKLN